MKILPWIISAVLAICLVFSLMFNHGISKGVSFTDTVKFIDTIKFYQPIPKDSCIIRYDTLLFVRDSVVSKDSIINIDSTLISLPITQKYYKSDKYEIWISGFNPSLDQVNLFEETKIVNVAPPKFTLGINAGFCGSSNNMGLFSELEFKYKPKKWSVFIRPGFEINTNGKNAYLKAGFSYDLFSK